ncbi:hypothetical protein AB0H43_16810 [Hamadaea sp. NPDC050747]|uniref:hypothetical protein n=1 Tax=Hamadaea sp. NPDC050747 TaxID=3155789 RepID=UPI003410ABF9
MTETAVAPPAEVIPAPAATGAGPKKTTTPAADEAVAAPEPQPVAAEQDDRQAEEKLDEWRHTIPPDSLRLRASLGAELYGVEYHDIGTYGPAAFGNHNIVTEHFHEAARPIPPHVGVLQQAGALLRTHTATPSDGTLMEKLEQRHAVCLTGSAGTGRFTSAVAALAQLHGPEEVYEIHLLAGYGISALEHHDDVFVESGGHILRVDHVAPNEVLGFLSSAAAKRKARVILIQEADPRTGEANGGEVRHTGPDPLAVFRSHLKTLLRPLADEPGLSPDPSWVVAYVNQVCAAEELCQSVNRARRPKEIVAIAAAIAKQRPDPSDLTGVLSSSQPRRRDLAQQVLACPQRPGILHPPRLNQHERAFRIAYTVFYSQAVNYVFEATGWLLEEMDEASARTGWNRPVLEHAVADLLGGTLAKDWLEESAATTDSGSRVAVLRDPGLRGAVLDVAWHEFDNARPALLNWLNRLASDDDEVMQRAAAEIAGLLAHFDFDLVFTRLVDVWAGASRISIRQVAAWAAATAMLGGHAGNRVLRRVRDWSQGTLARQHDTAARLYASGMRQPALAWTLSDLRHIASDKVQRGGWVIAEALNQLFDYADAAVLLQELARWSRDRSSPLLANHAARAMLAAADRADVAQPSTPYLLGLLAGGDVPDDDIAALWRIALLDPALAGRGWVTLARWIRAADVTPGLRLPIQRLLRGYADDPVMRRRLAFYRDRIGLSGAGWIDAMTGVVR